MYPTPQQLIAFNEGTLESAARIARANFAAFEKLAALNFGTAKAALEDGASHAKALFGAADLEEARFPAGQPSLEKAIAYARSVYEIASEAQGEIARGVEQWAGEAHRGLVALADALAKSAPAGSEVGAAVLKSALAAANSAYDSISKVAKQAAEIVEANFAGFAAPEIKKAA